MVLERRDAVVSQSHDGVIVVVDADVKTGRGR